MWQKRWQDWINVILGLWTFASPWILGFAAGTSAASRTMWILGAAIVVFAAFAVYMHRAWEEALNILLGVCLIASPWILGFAEQSAPTTTAVVVGLLVTAFAVWAVLKETAIQKWWHEHRPTP
jgi:SPW repeat